MIARLDEVLQAALADGRAVPGFVVLGWEDAMAYAGAGSATGLPVILQAGPGARAHTPLSVLGAMFRHLAESVDVPVVAHLDHSTDIEECRAAIAAGFSSVMFDGSRLPFDENVTQTAAVVAMARDLGVSVEGEIGFVGYDGGEASARTRPEEARAFAAATGVDALAVSVGNVHLQSEARTAIDHAAVAAIGAATPVPLVLHGGSGIRVEDRRRLATGSAVCKFNIGTELRQVFGRALREGLARHPGRFDRIEILRDVVPPLQAEAERILRELAGR